MDNFRADMDAIEDSIAQGDMSAAQVLTQMRQLVEAASIRYRLAPQGEAVTWLVWSNEHTAWWRPNAQGYTLKTAEAGRYTFDEARDICINARPRSGAKSKAEKAGDPPEMMVVAPESLGAAGAHAPVALPAGFRAWLDAVVTVANATGMDHDEVIPTWPHYTDDDRKMFASHPPLKVGDVMELDALLAGAGEQHPDDAAVDRFAGAMKAKLAEKRAAGRGGWQTASEAHLSALLHEHVAKGDPVDVGNLAMMLHQNGQRVAVHAQAFRGVGMDDMTVDQIKAVAAELAVAAETMSGGEQNCELMLRMMPPGAIRDDDGSTNTYAALTVLEAECPEEGVYQIPLDGSLEHSPASQVAVPEGWRLEPSKYGVIVTSPDGKMTEVQSPADPPIFLDDPVIYQFLKTILAAATAPAPDEPVCAEECPECGSTELEWMCTHKAKPDVVDGRLRLNEVEAVFALGCTECSETVRTMGADEACGLLSARMVIDHAAPAGEPIGSDDLVLVPRGLLAAACGAIRHRGHPADKTLAELRRYTTGDLSCSGRQPVSDPDELRQAAAEAVKAIRSIPEKKLLALDNDPHPPSTLSVSAERLELALSAPAPDEREIAAYRKALEKIAPYPASRTGELGYSACRRIAREALDEAARLRAGKEGEA